MADRTLIPITEVELETLIHESNGRPVNIAFGTGGTALICEVGEPMPWFIERIGLMRGVLNENCHGAGI